MLNIDNSTDIPGFNVYPNPTDNSISVNVSHTDTYSYELLDVNGRSVLKGEFKGTITTINISSLPAGHYLFLLKTTNATSFRTIVKKTH